MLVAWIFGYLQRQQEKTQHILLFFCENKTRITCLVCFSDIMFASASLDGTICVWRTDDLSAHMNFNTVRDPEGPDKTFPHSVQCLIALDEVCGMWLQRENVILFISVAFCCGVR